jgi:hypothetical protein
LAISCKQPSKASTTPREKKKKNEKKTKKKESGHMYSHPKSMAKGLTLP